MPRLSTTHCKHLLRNIRRKCLESDGTPKFFKAALCAGKAIDDEAVCLWHFFLKSFHFSERNFEDVPNMISFVAGQLVYNFSVNEPEVCPASCGGATTSCASTQVEDWQIWSGPDVMLFHVILDSTVSSWMVQSKAEHFSGSPAKSGTNCINVSRKHSCPNVAFSPMATRPCNTHSPSQSVLIWE